MKLNQLIFPVTVMLSSLWSCAGISGFAEDGRVKLADASLLEQEATPLAASDRAALERLGSNQFKVSCQDFERVAAKQENEVWCWAACAVMLHRWNGEESVSQEEIAERIHGSSESVKAASMEEIIGALAPASYEKNSELWEQAGGLLAKQLSGELGESEGVEFNYRKLLQAAYEQETTHSDILIEDLLAGKPAIVGLRDSPDSSAGHAYVVYAATFSQRDPSLEDHLGSLGSMLALGLLVGEDGEVDEADVERADRSAKKYGLWSVELVDPMSGSSQTWEAQRFADQVDFIFSSREAEAVLERQSSAWRIQGQASSGEEH